MAFLFHRFQKKPSWCGPAVITMILAAAGINQSQAAIAKKVVKPNWGTPHVHMLNYLDSSFGRLEVIQPAELEELYEHLDVGHLVILNIWDDLNPLDPPDGHYVLAVSHDPTAHTITLADPSNDRGGLWDIADADLSKRWYDFVDVHMRQKVQHWMLWVDLASKKV